jgi:hypothetical protein
LKNKTWLLVLAVILINVALIWLFGMPTWLRAH